MKIRLKLTLQFVLISALITFVAFIIIYALSANFRQEQFHDRLFDKAVNTAKLLVDVQEIDQNLLRIIEENTVSLVEERITIYDYNDDVVFTNTNKAPDDDPALLDKIRLQDDLRFSQGGREFIGLHYTGQFDRFVVIASAFDQYGLGKLKNLKWVLIFVFLGMLLITSAGGWLFAGQALKPITQVVEEVKQINDQSLGMRVNEGNGTDEIANLSKTFNLMLARLENAFYSQKSFVSHASHELRTPLTAITGQIEVALMNTRSEEEYRYILKSVLEDIRTLSALTNGLLELVQTNPAATKANFKNIRIDDVLFWAVEQTQKKHVGRQILLDLENFPKEEDDLFIRGNDFLLRSAFLNVIDNACKFSPEGEVKVIFNHKPHSITIQVVDKGIGISADEQDKIFQPFYRASNATGHRGHGLGLPLTKRILDIHEASLQVSSILQKGTVFTIILKKFKI
jgi:signal transduction histidine kinase